MGVSGDARRAAVRELAGMFRQTQDPALRREAAHELLMINRSSLARTLMEDLPEAPPELFGEAAAFLGHPERTGYLLDVAGSAGVSDRVRAAGVERPPVEPGAVGHFVGGALEPVVEAGEGVGDLAAAVWDDPAGAGAAIVDGVADFVSAPIASTEAAIEASAGRVEAAWDEHPARGVGRGLVEAGSVLAGGAFVARRGAQGLADAASDRPGAARADAPDVLPQRSVEDLERGERLGSGAHSSAYQLEDGRVAVVLQRANQDPGAAGAEVSAHLQGQLDYMHDARGVTFEGQPVAPRIDEALVDAQGRIVGFIGERVPGRPLDDLVEEGALSPDQLAEVRRQAEGQLDALHDAGFIHGDANGRNLLVDVRDDGSVRARFIDFEPPGREFGPEADAALLRRNLDDAAVALEPERVAARQTRRVAAAAEEAARAQLAAARAAHPELKGDLRRLMRQAPEGQRAELEAIYEAAGFPGQESRLLRPEQLAEAARRLDALGAEDVLRDAGASDELLSALRAVFPPAP
jgi:hypothetical protein